jgi:hypothetical protein
MKTFDEALRSTFCVGAEAENPEVALCIESQKGIMDEGSVSFGREDGYRNGETMKIDEIQKLPFVATGGPEEVWGKGWDFRDKTAVDLAPVCFGAYTRVDNPKAHKILYGGEERAKVAQMELRKLGIESVIIPPHDEVFEDEDDPCGFRVRVRGWAWSVEFTL